MTPFLRSIFLRKIFTSKKLLTLLVFSSVITCGANLFAQGTWTALNNLSPGLSGGGMLLLSDGTVLCKTSSGTTDGIGNIYARLTPDLTGSYANGSWSTIAPMHNTRLYYSTQLLKDGRVYVAGGEYGTGGSSGETYNPVTNVWTNNGAVGAFVSDANSEILENGTVLQALVAGTLRQTKIYDPVTNIYSTGPNSIGIHNESAWLKLADNSILFVDRLTKNSERYIPSLNKWVADATLPVDIYDPYGLEQGGAVLLPDGRALFLGSTGHNAIYTPGAGGGTGSWQAAADFPNGQGAPDAPAAMMVNGKVLCAVSPKPTSGNHFPTPTSFYEYDYITNTFTNVSAPGGGLTLPHSSYEANMVDLPNGQVLFCVQGSTQYYVYTPDGNPIAAGKPVITKIQRAGAGVFRLTGHLFNGISEGATYGDDWQMNSNYPLVRISVNGKVFYARSFNWNSTGVMRGAANDTVYVTPPAGLPRGQYSIQVVANGIASDPFVVGFAFANDAIADNGSINNDESLRIYPNPVSSQAKVLFSLPAAGNVSLRIVDASGNTLKMLFNGRLQQGDQSINLNVSGLMQGIYYVNLVTDEGIKSSKLVIK